MKSFILAALVGVAAMAVPAHAQIAAAIGKPLPAPDLAPGTVSVRIVAGKVSDPVVGTDVTLIVNGTPRQARTDAAGRASFTNLPVGATVQAKVTGTDEDKKEITSDEFAVPADGGDRVLLSTKPFVSMGDGGAPFAGGGGGGMPEPRQLSGQPRGEATDQPGTFTVRLTYDDLADKTPPVGVPVYLVGYRADDSVVTMTAKSDAAGRAVFSGLDRGGATSYFAMAQLVRGDVVDRLVSTPAVLDSRSGIRLILSGEKRGSKAPAVDDLGRLEKQDAVVAAGKVVIALQGVPEQTASVELVAMKADGSKRTLATVGATRTAPNPQDIQGQSQFTPKQDIPAHGLRIQVHGGPNADEPLGGVAIRLVPQSVLTPDADLTKLGTEYKTPDGGLLDVTDNSKEPVIASITINGKQMQSQPIDLAKSGGVLDIEAHWDTQGKLQAEFDVTSVGADEVLFAQSKMRSTAYRSVPFQPVAARGSKITLYIYPRIMFTFSLTSHIDDEFLAVGGRFDLTNNSWAPYVGGTDGLIIPLPAHFKGARVNEQDQDDVAVAQGEGFRIGRP
ncbi:MAG: carboxypeptidase-like regulatory domain-containing protein, partial [Kofleriaceae bacterium]